MPKYNQPRKIWQYLNDFKVKRAESVFRDKPLIIKRLSCPLTLPDSAPGA